MPWLTTTLQWYAYLFLIGIIFVPITQKFFGRFFDDHGYPFAKTIATILLTYTMFVLGIARLLPFTHMNLLLILGLWALISLALGIKNRSDKPLSKFLVIFEEILFLACLIFWVYVRGQEPSIHGLEKFMDFGFMNSALRGTYFPPQDIWLAGHVINYYYFGHLTGAVLTRLTQIPSYMTYNLILATLFATGVTQVFSLCYNLTKQLYKKSFMRPFIAGIVGTFIVNLAGNLHTIYLFTTGYQGDKPIPFWQLPAKFTISQLFNIPLVLQRLPENYWYPNATRFIPFTIHEFPIYSYVVADLHGHVFDIPFVLLTITILFTMFLGFSEKKTKSLPLTTNSYLLTTIFLGFLTSIHYMTNALDGPIYLLLSMLVLFILFRFTVRFALSVFILFVSFVLFDLPFSIHFQPFVSGIGVNCSPAFLTNIGKLGPFLFEKGNCQISPPWTLLVLWGFFWFNFIFFATALWKKRKEGHLPAGRQADYFILALFGLGTALLIIPEFFYIKDIYPAHFRANTMFKLGYQAFIMMGIASTYTVFYFKKMISRKEILFWTYFICFIPLFFLIGIYPTLAVKSYYGQLKQTPQLDGSTWILEQFPGYKEVIDFFNQTVQGQPTILEAQGDSYTDFDVVSAYTGLPTVGGWWVHEWLWRGSSDVIGRLIPNIQAIYEGTDEQQTARLVNAYRIEYIVVGPNERKKYVNLNEAKFQKMYRSVFISSDQTAQIFTTKRP